MIAGEPIAIIGIGCRLPGGVKNPDDLWKLLVDGVDAITEVPKERWHLPAMYHPDPSRPGRMYSRWGGFLDHVDRFDAQFFGITPREAAPADPQQRLLLEIAYEAVEDAGLTLAALAGKRAGVYVGISTFDYSAATLNDRTTIDAYSSLGSMLCASANRISYFFNLVGPSLAVDTACSSSLVAAHLGCQSIWSGESELVFIGGVNLMLRAETTVAACKASMLSPEGRCKSFDASANGFVRAEGGAVVILKPLARALADGDQIYALVRATSVNQDGRTEGITVPNRVSQEANIVNSLRLADIAPGSVQYVEAHGTGTAVGDPIEAAALGAIYGKARKSEDRCVIGSLKSNLGHLEAGAGIGGLIKATLCLSHRQIPANLHFKVPNPQISFDDLRLRVAQRLEPWPETYGQPPRAAVNSFGAGGTNGHAILEAPPKSDVAARRRAGRTDGHASMLPLSARSAPALSDLARSYLKSLRDGGSLQSAALPDICFSAAVKRSHHEFRLALVAHENAELVDQLEAFLRGDDRANTSNGRSSGECSRPVFVCSGMGQQWWAMGRELLKQEPVYRRALEEVNDLYRRFAGWSLLDELTADERSSKIQRTHVAQPAIFAMQVGLATLWRSWEVEPAAVLGHSAGEVAASYIAGALSLEDAVQVIFHRSRLLGRTVGQGSMLAAGIPREEAARLVERHSQAISIAAINAPGSVTLSGDESVLADIDKALNEAGLFSRRLQVEAPFHSQKMEQIEKELVECLGDIRPRPASTPFFSTVTGTLLVGTELNGQHWYRNTRQPVLFADTMTQLIKGGHRLFLEIGAHPVLRHDIGACLKEEALPATVLCSVRRGEPERAAMLGSLGRMYTLGAEIDWQKLLPDDARAIKLPLYPFQADIHWRESDALRRSRLGRGVHPLLGHRHEAPQPTWQVGLDTAGLSYLEDHRIGGSLVFPGAGYVEMGFAAAREIFGPLPCTLEDIEFQKLLVLDDKAACCAQVVFDAASNEFAVYARANNTDNNWELHARGSARQTNHPPSPSADLAEFRQSCSERVDPNEYYRLFADMGNDYGPAFRGIARLWRSEREALAEICAPTGVAEHTADYRFHPAVLDACLHSAMAAILHDAKGVLYVPVKIGRVRFHAAPTARMFAHTRMTRVEAGEMAADVQILDEDSNHVADVSGLVLRPSRYRPRAVDGILYEYQWQPSPRPGRGARDAHHLPSPEVLAPILQEEAQVLWQRFDRALYQGRFQLLSRRTAAAYIVHALRELGWTPSSDLPPIETLADRLGVAPQYCRFLRLVFQELTADEMASTEQPASPWKAAWDEFPECHAEMTLLRLWGDNLPAMLRGDIDPLNVIFPEGSLTTAEHLYQDSPSLRVGNLLVQKAVAEITRRLPKGKALRILEIGGGTGGMSSFVVPILPEHCTEYVFSDLSPHFLAHAQRKFARYRFVQYRLLDIGLDPLGQGFDPHSFDLIIASDVLHGTPDLRKTLDRVKQLLGSCGTLLFLEPTHPWLAAHLTFGVLKGWWVFEDHDLRPDGPCISREKWKSLLREAGFSAPAGIADSPQADTAQHSVLVARGPQLPASSAVEPQAAGSGRNWLVFAEDGIVDRPSAGAAIARRFRERGDRVIQVMRGAEFRRLDESSFAIRAGKAEDMRRVMECIREEAPQLAGIAHFWSLDAETSDRMSSDTLMSSVMLGCIGVLQLFQALAAVEGVVVGGTWIITRSVQPTENGGGPVEVAQSPLWGFGRVAMIEYHHLRCRLVDLATCSDEEISSLAEELSAGDSVEDEIALHGQLRYVHRLVPVSRNTMHGMGSPAEGSSQPFRIEVKRPGILDSLSAGHLVRTPPKSNEVEIEVAAAGLNFLDLMLAMGMLPKEAIPAGSDGRLLGMECAGRVVAVGSAVSGLAVGDEVLAGAPRSLATHLTVDQRLVALKPRGLSFEQAATIPVAFLTAYYALHTLGRVQRGERVLIHSATGGVGLAAVQLALRAGAIVFATAGSPEKRALLAALGVSDVMDSRTLDFADEVLKLTEGQGVDVVLNSLAGVAIDKNLSLLRQSGRFIEIGKVDIYQNRKIGLRPLRNNVSLFAVDFATAFDHRPELRQSVVREVLELFPSGDLHPLPHRVFPAVHVIDAFRQMAEAKHVGKLIISLQDSAGVRVERTQRAIAIDPDASYLISGGLGGFGLAVAERLVRRGARHLALVGRRAPSPSARAAVESLQARGVEVMIIAADIADHERVRHIIADVQRTMGPLRGIVHAAMVLEDASVESLTEERMRKVMAPKIMGAWNLHTLTSDSPLDFFVMFSSIASVLGNPGQANYSAGCAFLDALAYYRRARALPAVTLNWGWVGDVGHIANNPEAAEQLSRLGMRAIPVSQMLDVFDELMGSNAVQVSVINLEWKDFLRSMHGRIPARFADLADRSEAEADTSTAISRVREILEADARTLPPLLKTYLRDHFARAMGAPAARIDTEQSVLSLGLDSLIAVEVRNRINTDLGMNIPLAVFMQSASISALATYMMERMLGSDRGERSETENLPIAPEVVVDISPRAEHSGFAHTNKLIKEEVDAHSSVVAQARH